MLHCNFFYRNVSFICLAEWTRIEIANDRIASWYFRCGKRVQLFKFKDHICIYISICSEFLEKILVTCHTCELLRPQVSYTYLLWTCTTQTISILLIASSQVLEMLSFSQMVPISSRCYGGTCDASTQVIRSASTSNRASRAGVTANDFVQLI